MIADDGDNGGLKENIRSQQIINISLLSFRHYKANMMHFLKEWMSWTQSVNS